MTALAKSQDKIGWRNLMESQISKHFYEIQSIHLAFGTTYLNGEDWVKKTISQVLQITHSQWIYRNSSLHAKRRGYLRRQDMKEMMVKIKTLLDTRPDEVPTESKFLLEFDLLGGGNGSNNQSIEENGYHRCKTQESSQKAHHEHEHKSKT